MSGGLVCFERNMWVGDPTRRHKSSELLGIVDRAPLEGLFTSHAFFGRTFVSSVDELRIFRWPYGHKHRCEPFIAELDLVLRWEQHFRASLASRVDHEMSVALRRKASWGKVPGEAQLRCLL